MARLAQYQTRKLRKILRDLDTGIALGAQALQTGSSLKVRARVRDSLVQVVDAQILLAKFLKQEGFNSDAR
jgi:hypothetical protein